MALACFACLVFPFIYEPMHPERWDTFLIVFLLLLALDRQPRIAWLRWTLIIIMLAGAPLTLRDMLRTNAAGRQRLAEVHRKLLANNIATRKIYFPEQPGLNAYYLLYFPISVRLHPLSEAEKPLAAGETVYLAVQQDEFGKITKLPPQTSSTLIAKFPEIDSAVYALIPPKVPPRK